MFWNIIWHAALLDGSTADFGDIRSLAAAMRKLVPSKIWDGLEDTRGAARSREAKQRSFPGMVDSGAIGSLGGRA